MSAALDQSCASCRFWNHLGIRSGDDRGQCRRHAPQPANQAVLFLGEAVIAIADLLSRQYELPWPADTDAEATETTNVAMFPRTYDDDWCGDWDAP